jgi:hypothetical protein
VPPRRFDPPGPQLQIAEGGFVERGPREPAVVLDGTHGTTLHYEADSEPSRRGDVSPGDSRRMAVPNAEPNLRALYLAAVAAGQWEHASELKRMMRPVVANALRSVNKCAGLQPHGTSRT